MGIARTQLSRESIQILLIGHGDHVCQGVAYTLIGKHLRPMEQSALIHRLQRDRELEMGLIHVLDDHLSIGLNQSKNGLIGIAGPVRADHAELPTAPIAELKHIKGVGEASRSPPSGKAICRLNCIEDSARWR